MLWSFRQPAPAKNTVAPRAISAARAAAGRRGSRFPFTRLEPTHRRCHAPEDEREEAAERLHESNPNVIARSKVTDLELKVSGKRARTRGEQMVCATGGAVIRRSATGGERSAAEHRRSEGASIAAEPNSPAHLRSRGGSGHRQDDQEQEGEAGRHVTE